MATSRREVIWTQRARDGVDEAAAYIAQDSPQRALQFIERTLTVAESFATVSERGHVVPELNDSRVRELFVYRYRLLYEVTESQVTVLGFLHGARDFNRWWRGE